MSTSDSVVWILGAGFSRSLGGPLLPDLLSEKARAEVYGRFPDITFSNPAHEEVYSVYRQCLRGNTGSTSPKLWTHAEEFLAYLSDAAAGHITKMKVIEKIAMQRWGEGKNFREWIPAVTRLVALECAFATVDADPNKDEAWQPYIAWARQMQPQDSVVTFNYDLVLETLGTCEGVQQLGAKSIWPISDQGQYAQIYKLHGSIDWTTGGNGLIRVDDFLPLLNKPDCPVVMATPGRAKQIACSGVLEDVWSRALEAIMRATAVVFVGYRFPPSDAEARTRILQALARQLGLQQSRYIHTVLGPRTHGDDTVRLHGLLTDAMLGSDWVEEETGASDPFRFKINVRPLLAEDFFTIFNRSRLLKGL